MEIVGKTVGTTAFGDRPLIIRIIRAIEFWRALLFENRQLLLCRVQLVNLVSTLQYNATIATLTGWRSSLYAQPLQGMYCCILLYYDWYRFNGGCFSVYIKQKPVDV